MNHQMKGYFKPLWKQLKYFYYINKIIKLKLNKYRSIPLLINMSKNFENLIYERVISLHWKNNFLHKDQYGFRKKRMTVHGLTELVAYILKENGMINFYLEYS